MIGNCYIVMWILIISLVLLGVIALIAGIIRNKRLQKKIEKGELDRMPEVKEVDVECCGQHEVCERDSLLAAVSKKIEYYDDEELDQFIGKAGDAYTEEETEMFRDVLYTTLDVEVAGWVRSLQLRGIELPDDLKDEVFLIIGERRNVEVKKQMRGDGFTTIYILSTRPIGKSAGKHCLWDYRYIYRNPPPGIYQRRNHSCFFRRDRVRIVCRNFPDTIGSRILGIISFWCRVA